MKMTYVRGGDWAARVVAIDGVLAHDTPNIPNYDVTAQNRKFEFQWQQGSVRYAVQVNFSENQFPNNRRHGVTRIDLGDQLPDPSHINMRVTLAGWPATQVFRLSIIDESFYAADEDKLSDAVNYVFPSPDQDHASTTVRINAIMSIKRNEPEREGRRESTRRRTALQRFAPYKSTRLCLP